MYCPAHFSEQRKAVLLQLIRQHPLATVITQGDDGLVADHIPFLYQSHEDEGQWGRLIGHVAKANPIWQRAAAQEVLLVFQGASTYISPNWYATKAHTHQVVPTWNYAVVHVYARIQPITVPAQVFDILKQQTHQHEQQQAQPWQVEDAPAAFIEKLQAHIVGLVCDISRIEGKWKVSQNQPKLNQLSVIAGLEGKGDERSQDMAAHIRSHQ